METNSMMNIQSPTNGSINNPVTVVKLGGTEGVDFTAICQDIANLRFEGKSLVLVHGGSEKSNQLSTLHGMTPRFITSPAGFTSRYTDRQTLDIFIMAVNGDINTHLVEQLQALGVNALGLSGLDGRLVEAERKETILSVENGKRKVVRGDYTGRITNVNTSLITSLLSVGYTPVISPLAISANHEALNVDADRMAAKIAAALQAETLLLLTAVPGLMKSFPDETSLIRNLPRQMLEEAGNYAQGRMKKKILGAGEALQGGVGRVVIADGRVNKPVTSALDGFGTVIL
jgi:[amino group carrier protein]-L-2-aminoadipate 6-kinase